MAHTGIVRRKQDHNKQDWEANDFPILCTTCLGDDPYLRMTKETFGKECKTCSRPFTVFRWRPGKRARYKKTEICTVCAKLKNVCQTCILDLQYGLPSRLLDQAIPNAIVMPKSQANREFFMDQADTMIALSQQQREAITPDQMLSHLASKNPYQSNQKRVCAYYQKGNCTRGKDCPYRHEIEQTVDAKAIQNRYHGVNDPLTDKLRSHLEKGKLLPPQDTSITTLYIGGVKNPITEQDIREKFFAHGDVQKVSIVPKLESAFVTFAEREQAEAAVAALYKNLRVRGLSLSLGWGASQNSLPPVPTAGKQVSQTVPAITAAPGPVTVLAPPPPGLPALPGMNAYMFATPGQYYPSMDPTAQGSTGDIGSGASSEPKE